ncbi:DUF1015 family protein [Nocardiopsis sp. NRRL B-16309]|uniref:DUF1015 family protein n=1 Tax=Nocardiopsis sp. NRRL B-16309 TaxID=1519494 RepID=UPI0006B029F1|nr:DUF1015 domain-containing protein [Nocardiopsis sp. NRRL B-16309]KOX19127.1 hypothetical protein ADL05_06670 [Nocardiopsis sp. NRRL B-16309]
MPRQPLELAPFRGLRYTDLDIDRVLDSGELEVANLLAPPYDIPGPEATMELLRSDPHNAAYLTVPYQLNLTMPGSCGGSPARFIYEKAAARLRSWIDDGVLAQDEAPALYVYEQVTAEGDHQRGLIGALRLPENGSGPVRGHESVSQGPVLDRMWLMRATRANLEPIFLLYRGGDGAATRATESAEHHGDLLVDTRTSDGTAHRLWALPSTAEHARIGADLAGRTALIADGHHRYEAYRTVREHDRDPGWEYGLAFLVDSEAHPPRLGAIHRVLPGLDTTAAIATLQGIATVDEIGSGAPRPPESAPAPSLVLVAPDGTAHLAHTFDEAALERAMPSRSTDWRHLPTAILREVLLPRWGYADDRRIRMVHDDPDEAVRTAAETDGTAVLVPPMSVEHVYSIVDRGELTPRKSTSFGPKPRSGLVMRVLDQP